MSFFCLLILRVAESGPSTSRCQQFKELVTMGGQGFRVTFPPEVQYHVGEITEHHLTVFVPPLYTQTPPLRRVSSANFMIVLDEWAGVQSVKERVRG